MPSASRRRFPAASRPSRAPQPVAGFQVGCQVPAGSVRSIESAERRCLVRHFGVGLDDGVPLEPADASRNTKLRDRTRSVQTGSGRAPSDSESPFREDGFDLGERGRLGPERRPDLAAGSVRILRREAACSGAGWIEGEREGAAAAARRSPASSEGACEDQGSLHRQDDVPCVQWVVPDIAGRCIRTTLPWTELAHGTMHIGAVADAQHRGFEFRARALCRLAVLEVDQILELFGEVDAEVAAAVDASRSKKGRSGFFGREGVARVDVGDVMRFRFRSQARQQQTLDCLRLLLDTAPLRVLGLLRVAREFLRGVLQRFHLGAQVVVFVEVPILAQRVQGATHACEATAGALLNGVPEYGPNTTRSLAGIALQKTSPSIPRRDDRARRVVVEEEVQQRVAAQRRPQVEALVLPPAPHVRIGRLAGDVVGGRGDEAQHTERLQVGGQRRRGASGQRDRLTGHFGLRCVPSLTLASRQSAAASPARRAGTARAVRAARACVPSSSRGRRRPSPAP